MNALINAALSRSRTIFTVLVLVIVGGVASYIAIPKEAEPDIDLPYIYVSLVHEGISPEDAERLLVRPMETELRNIEGIDEMTASAREGGASVIMEFSPDIDPDQALTDVREAVDNAQSELPEDTLEPVVQEVSVSNMPSVVVSLWGAAPERTLNRLAENLQDDLESLPAVLEANIRGMREDLLEVVVDPAKMELYNINQADLMNIVLQNNRLVAAGTLDTGEGRFSVKVPGLVKTAEDVLEIPVRVTPNAIVMLGDLASVRRTFKDATSYSRVNGQRAISIEVVKRTGANTIALSDTVREVVAEHQSGWPAGVQATYPTDRSADVEMNIANLRNSVITAVLLVSIVVVAALGGRSAALVALAIPVSFLAAFLFLWIMGATVNNMVLFGLVLAVGMLVDGAIVVTEYADRKMLEGESRLEAYRVAAQRMAWPIISSTLTTLAAFFPLIFWPGMIGEFMQYLPVTLLIILTASLVTALIFLPTLGSTVGHPSESNAEVVAHLRATENADVRRLPGLTGAYARMIDKLVDHPFQVTGAAIALMLAVWTAYSSFGGGIIIFPEGESEEIALHVRARGNMSIEEKDKLVREVEAIILQIPDAENVYSRTTADSGRGGLLGGGTPQDEIGQITLDLKDWTERRPSSDIIAQIRAETAGLAGIIVEPETQDFGPQSGKDIEVQIGSRLPDKIDPVARSLRHHMEEEMTGLTDIGDTRPLPGIEWTLEVDRAEAGRYGASMAAVGNAVQLVTNGVKVGEYRPDDATDEVDIRVRFPEADRTLAQLDLLRVQTSEGLVPISNFVNRTPVPETGTINRVDAQRVISISANAAEGVLANDKVQEIRTWLDNQNLDPAVNVTFKGEDEQRRETEEFLIGAFSVSLFLMAIILVTQFNSFYHAFLILTAVVMSTVGVFLGLLLTGRNFSMVMTGIGVIALAGIVVNNNIVLIDTFHRLREDGVALKEAIIRTGAQRLRPVVLTTLTTVAGLLPMALAVNIDFISRELVIGSPYSILWVDLALAVVFGLTFATLLTLVMTPCMLALPDVTYRMLGDWRRRLTGRGQTDEVHHPAE